MKYRVQCHNSWVPTFAQQFMKKSALRHFYGLAFVVCTLLSPLLAPAETVGPSAEVKSSTVVEPTIDPDAKVLLRKVQQAYDQLKSAEFAGQVSVHIDIPTEAHKTNQQFTSSFAAPNKFKHQIEDGLLMGSSGGEVYIFNDEANSYLSIDLPETKVEMRSLPVVVPQVLQSQNPSLLFAISKNGLGEVVRSFAEIKTGSALTLEGRTYPVLMFCSDEQESELHIAIDTETHLIRRFTIDFKPALAESGVGHVQNAEVIVDYEEVSVNPSQPKDEFAWVPPEGSFNVREPAGAARPEKQASDMQGVLAPNFRLTTLEGRLVALSHLRGNVVVLDFWATWSPPSAKSLPKIANLALRESENDVHVFAVNLEEDKDKVMTYIDLKDVHLQVLMDNKGEVARAYYVKTIPQTIIIGRDGVVQKVVIGDSPDREKQIEQAVMAAKAKSSGR